MNDITTWKGNGAVSIRDSSIFYVRGKEDDLVVKDRYKNHFE